MTVRDVLELLAARNAARRELRAAAQVGSGVRWAQRRQMNLDLHLLNAHLDALDPAKLRALISESRE